MREEGGRHLYLTRALGAQDLFNRVLLLRDKGQAILSRHHNSWLNICWSDRIV
jgi:hypothetical protein